MTRKDLTFRVFVSSTFSDLIAERNALQENVFPKLRSYCAQRGAWFQAIDLRWDIGREAALPPQIDSEEYDLITASLSPEDTECPGFFNHLLVRCSRPS